MTREEAIQILKTQFPHDSVIRESLGTLIPELHENEDERIYNEIMEFFKMNEKRCIVDNSYTRWIAWLEKQKEQKPQDTVGRVSIEVRSNLQTDEIVRKTLIMLVNDNRILVKGSITNSDILNWLKGKL